MGADDDSPGYHHCTDGTIGAEMHSDADEAAGGARYRKTQSRSSMTKLSSARTSRITQKVTSRMQQMVEASKQKDKKNEDFQNQLQHQTRTRARLSISREMA